MTRKTKPTEADNLIIAKAFFDPEAKWETRHEQFVDPAKKKAYPHISFCPSDVYEKTQRTTSTIEYRNYKLTLEEVTAFFDSQDDAALHADMHERITTTRNTTKLVVSRGLRKLIMESETKKQLLSQIIGDVKSTRSFGKYAKNFEAFSFSDFYKTSWYLKLNGISFQLDVEELETTPEIDNFRTDASLYSGRPRVDVWQALNSPQNQFWQPYKIRANSPSCLKDTFLGLKDLDGRLAYRVAQEIKKQIADRRGLVVSKGSIGYDRMATTERADNLIDGLKEYISSEQRIREEVEKLMKFPYREVVAKFLRKE